MLKDYILANDFDIGIYDNVQLPYIQGIKLSPLTISRAIADYGLNAIRALYVAMERGEDNKDYIFNLLDNENVIRIKKSCKGKKDKYFDDKIDAILDFDLDSMIPYKKGGIVIPIKKERIYDEYDIERFNWSYTCKKCKSEVTPWDDRCKKCDAFFEWDKVEGIENVNENTVDAKIVEEVTT